MRKVLPVWAVRLLVAALLLAPMLVAVDGFARVRRRHEPVGPWVWWLVAARGAGGGRARLRLAARAPPGCCRPRRPSRWPAGAIPVGDRGDRGARGRSRWWRCWAGSRCGPRCCAGPAGARGHGSTGEGAGAALLVTWCAVAAVLWVRNPYAAALLVPGAHALLAVIAPEVRLRRALAVALVVVAAAPFLLVDLSLAGQLGLAPADFGWFCVLLVAGGVIGPLGWVIWSLVLGLPGRRPARGAAQPGERGGAGDAADHRARPGQLRGPGVAGRHGVGAAAMRRALRHRAGASRAAGAGRRRLTLAWQEPVSALRAARAQHAARRASCAR